MSPRPAPDLDLRRDQFIRAARDLAETDGWPAVTMRRLAGELGVTQPVLYSAFASRQALVDAVALNGFGDIAAALEAVDPSPWRGCAPTSTSPPRTLGSTRRCSRCPRGWPSRPTTPPNRSETAFSGIYEAFPDADGVRAEVAWSALHGLATLQASGRLRADQAQARLELTHSMLTQQGDR